MTNIHNDKILILDFGAQYTQLIARRLREFGVYCEIWAWDHNPADIAAFGAKGIILSGGPESTTEAGCPTAPSSINSAGGSPDTPPSTRHSSTTSKASSSMRLPWPCCRP